MEQIFLSQSSERSANGLCLFSRQEKSRNMSGTIDGVRMPKQIGVCEAIFSR